MPCNHSRPCVAQHFHSDLGELLPARSIAYVAIIAATPHDSWAQCLLLHISVVHRLCRGYKRASRRTLSSRHVQRCFQSVCTDRCRLHAFHSLMTCFVLVATVTGHHVSDQRLTSSHFVALKLVIWANYVARLAKSLRLNVAFPRYASYLETHFSSNCPPNLSCSQYPLSNSASMASGGVYPSSSARRQATHSRLVDVIPSRVLKRTTSVGQDVPNKRMKNDLRSVVHSCAPAHSRGRKARRNPSASHLHLSRLRCLSFSP